MIATLHDVHPVRHAICIVWQYELWRSVYSGSPRDKDRISPTVPGQYTWPIEGAMGYYGDIIAGPLPPLDCEPPVSARHVLLGCFADSKLNRLLNTDALELIARGPGGMTEKVSKDAGQKGKNRSDLKLGYEDAKAILCEA